jgi:putative transposase
VTTPSRQRTRLPEYDYRTPGAYFITICTHDRHNTLGEVQGDTVELTALGEIVERCWQAIPRHFPHTALDVHVIMPNHLHGIIWLREGEANAGGGSQDPCRATACRGPTRVSQTRRSPEGFGSPVAGSLPTIVRSTKSAVTNAARQAGLVEPRQPVWQHGFHEHVIRNEDALERVREYIVLNPMKWSLDCFNPHPH